MAYWIEWDLFYLYKDIFGNRKNYNLFRAELADKAIYEFMLQTRQVPIM